MINLYVKRPQSQATSNARKWLKKQKLPFKEINFLKNTYNLKSDLFQILSLLDEDVFEIISTRSKRYQALGVDFEQFSLSQLVEFLVVHPELLKHPLIFDESKVQIGFNSDEIRKFVPRRVRQVELNIFKHRIEKVKLK